MGFFRRRGHPNPVMKIARCAAKIEESSPERSHRCETLPSVGILQLQSKQFGKFAKVSYFFPVEKVMHGIRFRSLGNSYLSFLVHPLSNIGSTINDLCAARLARSEKPNDIEIHECQFRQIQNNSGTLLPEQLLLQFLDVFRLKVTNQTNRGPSVL